MNCKTKKNNIYTVLSKYNLLPLMQDTYCRRLSGVVQNHHKMISYTLTGINVGASEMTVCQAEEAEGSSSESSKSKTKLGFTSHSTARVILGQVHSIITYGARTYTEVTACELDVKLANQ